MTRRVFGCSIRNMWNLLGGIAGALGSVYGANASEQNAAETNAMNFQIAQATNANNMAINQANIVSQQEMNRENLAQQLNFAQNSPGWSLSDLVSTAKNVGINPLSALGVSGSSYSNLVAPQANIPMQTGAPMQPARDLASAYSAAGQSLGRSISAIQSPQDQMYDQAQKALSLQRGALENDFIRSKINALNAPGNPPGVPDFSGPGTKAGTLPTVQAGETPSGNITPVPPKEIGQLGFFHPASVYWAIQNMLMPTFGYNKMPGHENDWFNPASGMYQSSSPYWNDSMSKMPGAQDMGASFF